MCLCSVSAVVFHVCLCSVSAVVFQICLWSVSVVVFHICLTERILPSTMVMNGADTVTKKLTHDPNSKTTLMITGNKIQYLLRCLNWINFNSIILSILSIHNEIGTNYSSWAFGQLRLKWDLANGLPYIKPFWIILSPYIKPFWNRAFDKLSFIFQMSHTHYVNLSLLLLQKPKSCW